MSIYARNNATDSYGSVDFDIRNEMVDGWAIAQHRQTLQLLPPRKPGDFRMFYVWVSPDTGSTGIAQSHIGVPPVLPPGVVSKFISAWGTRPRELGNIVQQQDNNVVQFSYDVDYDLDYARPGDTDWVTGDGLWKYRGNYGGWPQGHCQAIYVRGEVGRQVVKGAGMCQINFASRCTEGTSGRPNHSWVTQIKGNTYRAGEAAAVAQDWLRVVIEPSLGQLGVMVNKDSIARYLNSGFELII